jgi:excisionase family DNA binding protein
VVTIYYASPRIRKIETRQRCRSDRSASLRPCEAAYSVNETLELLSIGRTSLYEAVKRGELRLVKFGKKTLVYGTDIAAFLTQLQDAGLTNDR